MKPHKAKLFTVILALVLIVVLFSGCRIRTIITLTSSNPSYEDLSEVEGISFTYENDDDTVDYDFTSDTFTVNPGANGEKKIKISGKDAENYENLIRTLIEECKTAQSMMWGRTDTRYYTLWELDVTHDGGKNALFRANSTGRVVFTESFEKFVTLTKQLSGANLGSGNEEKNDL